MVVKVAISYARAKNQDSVFVPEVPYQALETYAMRGFVLASPRFQLD